MLLRTAYAERAAGYVERAFALLQATVELNVHCPPLLRGHSTRKKLEAFEEFWESEVPKAGEMGARGWAHFYAGFSGDAAVEDGVTKIRTMPFNPPVNAGVVEHWAQEEAFAAARRILPMRVGDGDSSAAAEADPERVVFFEDLSQFCISLDSTEAQIELLLAMAAFLSLPGADTAHVPSSHPIAALHDTFRGSEPVDSLGAGRDHQPGLPVCASPIDSCMLWGAPCAVVHEYRRRLLAYGSELMRQACEIFPADDRLAYLAIRAAAAFAAADNDPPLPSAHTVTGGAAESASAARRAAKMILRARPNDLGLYLAYAQACADAGHLAQAAEISSAALQLGAKLGAVAPSVKSAGSASLNGPGGRRKDGADCLHSQKALVGLAYLNAKIVLSRSVLGWSSARRARPSVPTTEQSFAIGSDGNASSGTTRLEDDSLATAEAKALTLLVSAVVSESGSPAGSFEHPPPAAILRARKALHEACGRVLPSCYEASEAEAVSRATCHSAPAPPLDASLLASTPPRAPPPLPHAAPPLPLESLPLSPKALLPPAGRPPSSLRAYPPPTAAAPVPPQRPSPATLTAADVRLLSALVLFEMLTSGPSTGLGVMQDVLAALEVAVPLTSAATSLGPTVQSPEAAPHLAAEPFAKPSSAMPSLLSTRPRLFGHGSRAHESLFDEFGWVLRCFGASYKIPAVRVRCLYEAALHAFPANPSFLFHLAATSVSTHMRFHLRRTLSAIRKKVPQCVPLWMGSVWVELGDFAHKVMPDDPISMLATRCARANASGSEVDAVMSAGLVGWSAHGGSTKCCASHALEDTLPGSNAAIRRTRSLLELAVQTSACGNCPAVWRLYMRLELLTGEPQAAARLQLRAVQQCPGVKSLWLDALRYPLLLHVPTRQLGDTIELLQEKEIRLCVDLPSVLEVGLAEEQAHAPRTLCQAVQIKPTQRVALQSMDGTGNAEPLGCAHGVGHTLREPASVGREASGSSGDPCDCSPREQHGIAEPRAHSSSYSSSTTSYSSCSPRSAPSSPS